MCVRSAEVVAMSCGIDYRHCPLKKRPVYIGYDSVEEPGATGVCDLMEPENLSMKPEDLRSTCKIFGHTKVVDSTFSCPTVSDESQSCLILASADLSRNYQFRVEPSPEQFDGFFHVSEDYSRNLGTKGSIEYYPSASRFPTSYIGIRHLQRQHRTTSDNQGDNYYHPNLSTEHLLSVRHLKCYKSYLSPLKKIHPYQRARSCELTTTSQTSSHFPGSYEADSFQSKTHEDLLSPGSVTSSEGSSISSSGYDNGPKCERRSSRYQCSFCLKTYSTHSGLLKHKDFHCAANKESTAKKAFICKYCQKVYLSLGALKMHIRTHTLPCKCVICGKAFSRPWLLQGHIRTHTGEKPFSCPLCERAFADRSNLRAHLQTHSEVKKYSCASCGKTFSRMSLLTKHQESGCSTL